MIKAIIFDCFGVFYVDPVLSYMHDPSSPPDIAQQLHELDRQASAGLIDRHEFDAQAAELLHMPPDVVDRRFFGGSVRNDALLAYAETLRPTYKTAMLTNIAPDMMDNFFAAQEREQLFDVVVMSGAIGMLKPHPEIFVYTAKQLGVDPTEAVMIDDSPDNCAGAKQAGMQAVVYESTEQVKQALGPLLHTSTEA